MVPTGLLQDSRRLQLTVSISGVRYPDIAAGTICGIDEAIEYVSSCAELWRGDLVCIALSPARDGRPPWRMRCGESVEVAVEGLGRQRFAIGEDEHH